MARDRAPDRKNPDRKKAGARSASGRKTRARETRAKSDAPSSPVAGAADADETGDGTPAVEAPGPAGGKPQANDEKAGEKRRRKRGSLPPVPVVGIGASAGGLEAFKNLLQAMPADTGIAFVLIQHLDPKHESLMADLLSKYTSMPVVEAENATSIQPNRVYMIPPNKFLKLQDDGLFLDEPVKQRGMKMPIDYFFRSLAEARRERAICIVLSGTGSDGTIGLREVKGAGGLAMVQQPETADYDGMPRSAIATGMVDFVLPIEKIPATIQRYVAHPYVEGSGTTSLDEASPEHFLSVLHVLQAHTDYDFRTYKKPTLNRRIQRRMSLRHVDSIGDYLRILRSEPDEVHHLFKDLLIGVTRFFREKEAWVALEDFVSELVQRSIRRGDPVRVWVPGCATGEEAYSLAMLFAEHFERQKQPLNVQIFGTDIDPDSIAVARAGVYPASIAQDVSSRRLQTFFKDEGDKLRVAKRLRETTVFAIQNLISDPPFSNLDLISCRNVLIYLEGEIQRRILKVFHFALRDQGLLQVGNSETVGRGRNLFESVSATHRFYRKIPSKTTRVGPFPVVAAANRPAAAAADPRPVEQRGAPEVARHLLLEGFAPASVLINRRHEVLYQHGPLRHYLDFPSGEPSNDLPTLAAEGLRAKLRAALQKAIETRERAEMVAPRVRRNGSTVAVEVIVQPGPGTRDDQQFLVSFRDVETPPPPPPSGKRQGTTKTEERTLLDQLEYELQATREDLQSTIEELETSNEELKASNEEAMSMNEELQSTNEELETSKEELQSLNEELSTVNNQLEEKVDQLEAMNNDLGNFLSSTEIATVFLDTQFHIRRYTPAAAELFHVIESDLGRPISDLAPRVHDENLLSDAQQVLDRLQAVSREVESPSGQTYIRRILPYRTAENRIEGVVITFTDVSELRRANLQLERRERQQALIAALGRQALTATRLQPLFELAVSSLQEGLAVEYTKVLELKPEAGELVIRAGVGWSENVVPGETRVPAGHDSQAGFTLQARSPVVVEDLPREKRFRGPALLTEHAVRSGLSTVIGSPGAAWGVLGAHTREKRPFSVDDVHFLEAVANVLADAIESFRVREELKVRARQISLLYRATTERAESLHDALRNCIGAVCEVTGWPVGHAYLPSADYRHMESSNIWRVDDPVATRELRELSDTVRFSPGEGFVGRVWASGVPLGVRDVNTDPHFLRARLGSSVPVRSAFGFPVVVDGRTVAILEFFSYDEIRTEDQPLEMVRTLGEQVGRAYERQRAEAEQAANAERLSLALEAGGLAAWDWDLERDVITWSDTHFRMLGYEPNEVTPSFELWQERVHPDDRKRALEEVERARNERRKYLCEYRIVQPSGAILWVEAHGAFSYDERGVAYRMYGVMIDVTQRHQIEHSLREADRRKDAFLATLGHELRNPLSAITTGIAALQGAAPGHEAEIREMLARQAANMGYLLDDLLDVSRITRGDIELRPVPLAARAWVDGALETLANEIKGRHLDVSVDPPDLQLRIDPVRAEQILVNLLSNAIRYSESDEPIRVEIEGRNGEAQLRVIDAGLGLAPEEIVDVFEPFYQVRKGSGGLGLGLSLVRHLVELHGGHVNAQSGGRDKGSTFTVTLPAAAGKEPDTAAEGGARGAGRRSDDGEAGIPRETRLLIVDDHEDSAQSLAMLLSSRCQVDVAEDGATALEKARALRPDAILLDLGLPDLSGIEVARRIRAGDGDYDPVILAVTGFGDDGSASEVRDAGFHGHIVKPVEIRDLLAQLRDLLRA